MWFCTGIRAAVQREAALSTTREQWSRLWHLMSKTVFQNVLQLRLPYVQRGRKEQELPLSAQHAGGVDYKPTTPEMFPGERAYARLQKGQGRQEQELRGRLSMQVGLITES